MILRRRTGLTQVQLASKLGKSPSTIAKWEARDIVPKLKPSEMKRLCEAFNCTLDELVEAFEGKSAVDSANIPSAIEGNESLNA